jgi:predicted transcriptional regulator of viral defense system
MRKNNIVESPSTQKNFLLQKLLSQGLRVFTNTAVKNIAGQLDIDKVYTNIILHNLIKEGWIKNIRKGLYSFPATIGIQPIHEFEIAMQLVKPAMISHYSAFYHHELTDQIPRDVFVSTIKGVYIPKTDKQSELKLDGVRYRIIQIIEDRFFGSTTAWKGEVSFRVTDLERTLLDGLAAPQYCGGFAEVLYGFREKQNILNIERLINYALRLDIAVSRRLGWILDKLGIENEKISCLAQLNKTGYRRLDPTSKPVGKYDKKWFLQLNYEKEYV